MSEKPNWQGNDTAAAGASNGPSKMKSVKTDMKRQRRLMKLLKFGAKELTHHSRLKLKEA